MYAYPAVRNSIDRFIGADELKAIEFKSRMRTRKATEVMGADELTASGPSTSKRRRKATEIVVADELLELESSSRKKKREVNEVRSLRAAKRLRGPCCYFIELPAGKSLPTQAPATSYILTRHRASQLHLRPGFRGLRQTPFRTLRQTQEERWSNDTLSRARLGLLRLHPNLSSSAP
jgi:hypothetical protein